MLISSTLCEQYKKKGQEIYVEKIASLQFFLNFKAVVKLDGLVYFKDPFEKVI